MKRTYPTPLQFLFIIFLSFFVSMNVMADDDDDDDEEDQIDTVYRSESGVNLLARQEVTTRLEPLGFGLMGDTVDPVTGTLVFNQTDVSLPGNSDLEVAIRRMASSGDMTNFQEMFFGDWMLNTPQISKIVQGSSDWNTEYAQSACTIMSRRLFSKSIEWYDHNGPSNVNLGEVDPNQEGAEITPATYSDGVNLSIPGSADQKLISVLNTPAVKATWSPFNISFNRTPIRLQGPVEDSRINGSNEFRFPEEELAVGTVSLNTFVTKNHWVAQCQTDETVLVKSPDGTRYNFSKSIYMPANDFEGDKVAIQFERSKAVVFATQVTDIHGNWVKYDYTDDGKLTRIYSNDDREITLTYIPATYKINTVTANGRTWRYEYRDINKEMHGLVMKSVLHKVIQPDGNYWEYDLEGLTRSPRPENRSNQKCYYNEKNISIKHPYGVEATYNLGIVNHGASAPHYNIRRINYLQNASFGDCVSGSLIASFVPSLNPIDDAPNDRIVGEDVIIPGGYAGLMNTLSVFSKTLKGPSIPESTWEYTYSGYGDTAVPLAFKSSTVVDPVGRKTVSHFYNEIINPLYLSFSLEETEESFTHRILNRRLSKQEQFSIDGELLQTKKYNYEISKRIGLDLNRSPGRATRSSQQQRGPLSYLRDVYNVYQISDVTERDGDTFTREYTYNTDLDSSTYSYGQPLTIKTHSNISTTPRETVNAFEHRKDHWVLNLPESVTVNGREMTRNGYDDVGKQLWVEQYGYRVAAFTYQDNASYYGALETFTDAEGRVTKYLDYFRGIARSIERNDGSTDYVNVDDNGWVIGQTDYRGFTTGYERDNMGRVTKIIPSKTQKQWFDTNITYDFGDYVTQTIKRNSKLETVTYDNFLRTVQEKQTSLTTNKSIYSGSTYNEAGEMIFQSFPQKELPLVDGTEFSYDGLGRRKTVTENVAPFVTSSYEYLNNHRTQITDPLGNQTTRYNNGFGELVRIKQPLGVNTYLNRNSWGQLTSLNQSGVTDGINKSFSQHSYYDDRQRLCRHRTPEGRDSLYQYDDSGRMVAYSKGNTSGSTCIAPSGINKVSMSLDTLGRVDAMDYDDPATADIQTTYDANGNVKNLNRGGMNWRYVYDEANRLLRETLAVDGREYANIYQYNRRGFLSKRTLPSGLNITRLMDGLDRTLQVKTGDYAYGNVAGYHANGLISNMQYGNGQIFSQTLTERQQPLRTRSFISTNVALDYTYTYDKRSSITNIDDKTTSNFDQGFTYDALDRLETATGPWGNGAFKYDALGNLLEKTLGSRDVTVEFDSNNRAIRSTDTENGNRDISYDNRGNVTGLGDLSFIYDNAQQPVSISGKANGTYQYDGNFKRVKSVVDGKTIYNIYDAAGQLTHVDAVTDGNATDYIRLNGKSIARIKNDVITYLHNDHRGSAVAGTDANGDITWKEEYTPYGEKRIDDASNQDQASFTGHIDDSATGLTYMQARYYDPTIGRFLSIDPVGFRASNPVSFNRYTYVNGNPNKYDDPDGEFANFLAGAAAGAILEIAVQVATGTFGEEGSAAKIAIAAVGGSIGAGLGAQVGKLANVGLTFATSALEAGAVNVVDGKPLTEGVLTKAVTSAGVGAAVKGFADKAGNIAAHKTNQINTATSTAADRGTRSAANRAQRADNATGASVLAGGAVNTAAAKTEEKISGFGKTDDNKNPGEDEKEMQPDT